MSKKFLLAFWACLLCEPGLTAAIPVATEWPATESGAFTPIDYDLSWWTSSDYFEPTVAVTAKQEPAAQRTASPAGEGTPEANPGPAHEANSTGFVGNETQVPPWASKETDVDSGPHGPDEAEATRPGAEAGETATAEGEGAVGKANSSNPSVDDGPNESTAAGSNEAAPSATVPSAGPVSVASKETPEELLADSNGGMGATSAGGTSPPEEGHAAQQTPSSLAPPFSDSLSPNHPTAGSSGSGDPGTVSIPLSPGNEPDLGEEPVPAGGRGDAAPSGPGTASHADETATGSPPSEDAGLSPGSAAKGSPGEAQDLEGGDAWASSPADGAADPSVGSSGLGPEATLASSPANADTVSEDSPSFIADTGARAESDWLPGETAPSAPLGSSPPEAFSVGGQAGEATSSPSSERLGPSPDVGVGDSWNGSSEAQANAPAAATSQAKTGLPPSEAAPSSTEKGKEASGVWTSGETSTQPSVQGEDAVSTSQALGQKSPSNSASPVEGEVFPASGVSGEESHSVPTLLGAKFPPSSGAQPTEPSGIPVSPASNVLQPGSDPSKNAQGPAGPLNIIWKETPLGPSGAEPQAAKPSTGVMGTTDPGSASENGSQLSPDGVEGIQDVPSERAKSLLADVLPSAAKNGEVLPSPDGSATAAEKTPGSSSSGSEKEASLIQPAPGSQSDSSYIEGTDDAMTEGANDEEPLSSPDGSATEAEKASFSVVEDTSLVPPASASQSASPSTGGTDDATTDGANDEEPPSSPDGSATEAEKAPEGSSSVGEETSLVPVGSTSQSASPSTEGTDDATSEGANDEEPRPSPDGSATEAEKAPEDSTSVGEKDTSVVPAGSTSQSASPSTEGTDDATSEGTNDGDSLPPSYNTAREGAAMEASPAPSAIGSPSSIEENAEEGAEEKSGSTADGGSFPQPSSVGGSVPLGHKTSGEAVTSGSSSPEGSLASQGTSHGASDIISSNQLPSGSETISDKGTSPDSTGEVEPSLLAGSGQPDAELTGVVVSEPSSALPSQRAGIQAAEPSRSGLASPSNELVAPSQKPEGRGDADSSGSTVDKDTSAATGEEVHLPLPGGPLDPSKTQPPRPAGEAEIEVKAEGPPQSSKDEVTGTGDEQALSREPSTSAGLGTAKSGSVAGPSVSQPADPSAKTKPAVRVSVDSSGHAEASPTNKSGAKHTTPKVGPGLVGPGPVKLSPATGKTSEKKEDKEKSGKKQASRKTEKKKDSKSSEENSDADSSSREAKNTNKNSDNRKQEIDASNPGPSDVRGLWLHKPDSWMQLTFRRKCLGWVSHEQLPSFWNKNLPPCPCTLQQGLSDHRYTRSQKGLLDSRFTMLHSSKPNEHGAGVRCLYHKNNNQLMEGHQERVWKPWRTSSPIADGELKLYDWCCNQAGNQQFCDKYNQKRPRIGCAGYRPPVQG